MAPGENGAPEGDKGTYPTIPAIPEKYKRLSVSPASGPTSTGVSSRGLILYDGGRGVGVYFRCVRLVVLATRVDTRATSPLWPLAYAPASRQVARWPLMVTSIYAIGFAPVVIA